MEKEPVRLATFGFGQQNELTAEEFGNKAAGLATMAVLGIPVPCGFSLSVSLCRDYFDHQQALPPDTPQLFSQGITFLEQATGSIFGGERHPLLVSVRSGSPVSMPGIMDTILNVGLTPVSVRGMMAKSGSPRFVYDTYRRFLENFGVCVFNHDPRDYHLMLQDALLGEDLADERELDFQSLRTLCDEYTSLYVTDMERSCIPDARRQLECATISVLRSWMNLRAMEYRRIHGIRDSLCTAVTIQSMVFGNLGASSGAGVAFTRNPWTGIKDLLIDFRFGAQGEDVVSGARSAITQVQLAGLLPDVYREILQIGARLEEHYRDMQDLEFTIQEGRLFILQCRTGKRSPLAEFRIVIELCEEGILSWQEAQERINKIATESLELQEVRSDSPPAAYGISASGGVAQGSIAFSAERAVMDRDKGPIILVRDTATPDDIAGIDASAGILTARGARTSHAAVVARQMGKVCIVNCTDLHIEPARHRCTIREFSFHEGDVISLDGNSGAVFKGPVQVIRQKPEELLAKLRQLKKER